MKVECQERNGEGNGRERKELKVEGIESRRKGKERGTRKGKERGKERKEERGNRRKCKKCATF